MLKSKNCKMFEEMIEYLKANDEIPTYDTLEKAGNELGYDYLSMLNADKSYKLFKNEFSIIDTLDTLESTMREAFEKSFNGLTHVNLKHELIYSPSKDLDELLAIGVKQTITLDLIDYKNGTATKNIVLENCIDVKIISESITTEMVQSTLAFKGPHEIMKMLEDEERTNISTDGLSPYVLTSASMNVVNGLQTKTIKELLSIICKLKYSSDEQ